LIVGETGTTANLEGNESNIPHEPRRIEIIEDEEDTKAANPKVDECGNRWNVFRRNYGTATGLKPRF